MGKDKHSEIRPLQQEPVEIRDIQRQFGLEQSHYNQIRQVCGQDAHAADHRCVHQRLDHYVLFGGLLFRGISEQPVDAVYERQEERPRGFAPGTIRERRKLTPNRLQMTPPTFLIRIL